MPHSYYQKVVKEELGFELGQQNSYGSGIVFTPHSEDKVKCLREIFASQASLYGFEVLGWRTLKTDNSALGGSSKSTEPRMEQVFIQNTRDLPWKAFDAELYKIRRMVEHELQASEDQASFYVCSLSSQTITYKGQLTPEQVFGYYQDLQSEDFASHLALVHSRFSTNTFPSWERAQPIRMMCHNGEINTLRGNKNWMYSRSGLMSSPLFGEAISGERLLPTSDQMSDSGNFDSVLELLAKGSPRVLPECIMMMIPEAWQDNIHLSNSKRSFYEYNSCVMEPWDGPAMIAFTDGRYIGATLDRNGLRPSRYYVTKDDVVLLSSEIGVLPDLPESNIRLKSRLEPGKMFLVDFEKGAIISDNIIKEEIAGARTYDKWLEDSLFTLDDWVQSSKCKVPEFKFTETTQRLNMFGYTVETLDMLLYPMGVGGKEALGSMGNDAALAVMSKKPRLVFDYFKQLFAQVCRILNCLQNYGMLAWYFVLRSPILPSILFAKRW
jgi:glutamate synthase (NADPH/NADH)